MFKFVSKYDAPFSELVDSDDVESIELEDVRIDSFLSEVIAVCKKHGFSLSHEDCHGGFIVTEFDQDAADWLFAATPDITYKKEDLVFIGDIDKKISPENRSHIVKRFSYKEVI